MPIEITSKTGVLCITGTRNDGETAYHKTLQGSKTISRLATEIIGVSSYLMPAETGICRLVVSCTGKIKMELPINADEHISAVKEVTEAWTNALVPLSWLNSTVSDGSLD